MRKLVYLVAVAALAVPAFAVAASPSPADKAAAVKQCTTERTGMGAPAFKLLYGTGAMRFNDATLAFARPRSTWLRKLSDSPARSATVFSVDRRRRRIARRRLPTSTRCSSIVCEVIEEN